MGAAPSVTLALPAYNEEKRLEQSVYTLLNQSFTDFELLLGDNASTDATLAIMHRLAALDSRVRVIPAERNGGAVWNFKRLLTEARGEYFAWVGAHDVYQPQWLSELLSVISADERVVLAYPSSLCLLPDYSVFNHIKLPLDTRTMLFEERVEHICGMSGAGTMIYGLFRSRVAQACPLDITIRWDGLYLARMALRGDFVSVNQPLWYRFYEYIPKSDPNVYQNTLRRQYRTIYAPGSHPPLRHLFPIGYHLLRLVSDICSIPLPDGLSRRKLAYSACSSYYARSKKNLRHEIRYGVEHLARRAGQRIMSWVRPRKP